MDCGIFFRWSRWEMRSRQRLETHLQQQVDLYGTREMISARMSSVSVAIGSLPSTPFLEPGAIAVRGDEERL
uniref:Uncharacterized protein n=1 Tax=Triticum urartu TaxID=4572 RepID=A0A8R7PYH0_TRIUA